MKQPTLKKTHIVIVDDDWNNLRSMEFVLTAANYEVSTLARSSEALQRILAAQKGHNPVDLLITDVQKPGLNGWELLGELRGRNIDVPALLIGADSDQDLQFAVGQFGHHSILIKPFDEVELLASVAQLLEAKQRKEIA